MIRYFIAASLFAAAMMVSPPAYAAEPAKPADATSAVDPADLKALDHDIAAADEAAAKQEWDAALKFVDYTGHEEEAFAKAMLRYGASQATIRKTVTGKFGAPGWKQAAKSMRLSEGPRGDKPKHTARRVDGLMQAKTEGAETEVPYVKVEGVWKLSVRDVIFQSLKSVKKKGKDGKEPEIEEAVVFAVAGKIAKVLDGKSDSLDALASDVRDGKIESIEAFKRAAAERFPASTSPKPSAGDKAKPKR